MNPLFSSPYDAADNARKAGKLEFAISILREVLKLKMDDVIARKQLHSIYLEQMQLKDANANSAAADDDLYCLLVCYEEILGYSPKSRTALAQLIRLCDLLKLKESAGYYRSCLNNVKEND